MGIWNSIKQHLFNKNCIWNHSVCGGDCDYYKRIVVDTVILICTDKTLNNTITINTSKASKLFLILLLLLLPTIIAVWINVILQSNRCLWRNMHH